MRKLVVLAMLCAGISAASADDRLALANELGILLASEARCDLAYNPALVKLFIADKVRDDDIGFMGALAAQTEAMGPLIDEMAPTARSAHCFQVWRVAKSYGFIKE